MQVVVIGGGIAGLATGLFLGRRGHAVSMLEKETRSAGGDLERDFFEWVRVGVPQATQPHNLHSPVRKVLLAEAPDVYDAMLRLGAQEWHELDRFAARPPYQRGDEELITIRARRIVVETALAAAVRRQPEVVLRHGESAIGLLVDRDDRMPRVVGVKGAAGPIAADLVIDATGRRSPVPRWLVQSGARTPVIESHRTGIAYFCRWYRVRVGAPRRPNSTVLGGATSFAISGVFPSDNGVFAVHVAVSTGDPTRAALRDPAVFEAVARTFPGCADWLGLAHDAIGPVRVMAGLENRRTSLIDEDGPIVAGLLGVGDSVLHTNPTLGLGIPFALQSAAWVAEQAGDSTDATLPVRHDRWIRDTQGPWFDHQVRFDRAGEDRLRYGAAAPSPASAVADVHSALPWCALDDPQVMRARARVRNLLDLPETLSTSTDIRRRVEDWLVSHPNFVPPQQGPSRAQWEDLTCVNTGRDSASII